MYRKKEPIKLTKNAVYISAKQYATGPVPLHWHDFYEWELVVGGSGTIVVNGTEYPWQTGEMSFMRLTDFHEINLSGEGELHLIQIPSGQLPEALRKLISTESGNLITCLSPGDFAYADTVCRMIAEETEKEANGNPELLEHLLCVLMHLFARSLGATPSEKQLEKNLLSDLLLFIGENFREPLTLTDLAEHFFISKNHLCSYFKQHMNTTVVHYIKHLRLGYARKLALNTGLKSIEICEACGYGSPANFLRDFKKQFGVSPLEMRKNAAKN